MDAIFRRQALATFYLGLFSPRTDHISLSTETCTDKTEPPLYLPLPLFTRRFSAAACASGGSLVSNMTRTEMYSPLR